MLIDIWVWMMPLKFVEKVVDFHNFQGEVGHPREGDLRKVVVWWWSPRRWWWWRSSRQWSTTSK